MTNNSKIEKSPDDEGYMLFDSKGVITRVWAMPEKVDSYYDIYRLDRMMDLRVSDYFIAFDFVLNLKLMEN